jgi:hypothetical protein
VGNTTAILRQGLGTKVLELEGGAYMAERLRVCPDELCSDPRGEVGNETVVASVHSQLLVQRD